MTDTINGYKLTSAFTTAGGGQSRWAFAERRGNQYFLKEFLSPKYPVNGAPGSATTKARLREICAQFESHHRRMMTALAPLRAAGGNLIVAADFFRHGTRYYKVTEKVDVSASLALEISRLSLNERLLPMITVAHSLNILHRAGLVHGDIKPPNILIKRLDKGGYSSKLIDFDNAVFVGDPLPPPEQLVGDMAYYSPELIVYLDPTAAGGQLGCPSDIFALGLVFAEWLTGKRPQFPEDAGYAGVAVARGQALDFGTIPVPDLELLLKKMVDPDPHERPLADRVHAVLRDVRASAGAEFDVTASPTSGEASAASPLRGSLAGRAKPAEHHDVKPEAKPSGSSPLRGSLVKKTKPE